MTRGSRVIASNRVIVQPIDTSEIAMSMKAGALKCKQFVPAIASSDVRKTVEYYVNVLGFRQHFIYGEPPVYAAVTRDSSLLYITLDEALVRQLKDGGLNPDVFLWVEGVDELYQEHKAKGAKIFEEIADR